MLVLVKDFDAYEFFFYWIDSGTKKPVSPKLPTLEYAKEWWVNYKARLYSGEERRKTTLDRRDRAAKIKLSGTQIFFSKRRPQTCQGRRETDKPVEVSIDLSVRKLANLSF